MYTVHVHVHMQIQVHPQPVFCEMQVHKNYNAHDMMYYIIG